MNGIMKTSKRYWYYLKIYFFKKKYRYKRRLHGEMKVNIVVKGEGWILNKFAKEMNDCLMDRGIDSKVSITFDPTADINHYFAPFTEDKADSHTTFMITHVMRYGYLDRVKKITDAGAIGVCMSKETMEMLVSCGVARNKICYINPAQDNAVKPRKIILGFTHRIYKDNRKRETIILDIFKQVNSGCFKLCIMGAGWEDIVAELNEMGIETEYYSEFDKDKYNRLIEGLDYYCYFGTDEGSMGFLDAVAAGIKTIVVPQGFHLDVKGGITHPVRDIEDIVNVLHKLELEKKERANAVSTWTWGNFTQKHIEVWKYMLGADTLENILKNRGWYYDGIFSLMVNDTQDGEMYETLGDIVKRKLTGNC